MADAMKTKEFIRALAEHMNSDETKAEAWTNGMIDVMYKEFRKGKSVTLTNFGNFYVKRGSPTWTFKFNPSQKLRMLLGWSSTYKG